MARTVHLKLSGKAEKFVKKLEEEGLMERDIFSKALSILNDVHKKKRVGLIAPGHETDEAVEYLYGINVTDDRAEHVSHSTRQTAEQPAATNRVGDVFIEFADLSDVVPDLTQDQADIIADMWRRRAEHERRQASERFEAGMAQTEGEGT
jgi:hypothetical protein